MACDIGTNGVLWINNPEAVSFNLTEFCVLVLIKPVDAMYNVHISGADVGAYVLQIAYPFDITSTTKETSFSLSPHEDVAYVYIGTVHGADAVVSVTFAEGSMMLAFAFCLSVLGVFMI